MTTVYDWDPRLPPRGIAFNKRGMSLGGPPSITNRTMVTQTDAGFWLATYTRVPAAGPLRVNAFRAMMALQEGGARHVRVPVYDKANAPWPVVGGLQVTETESTGFSDGTEFSDGTGFFEPTIRITLAEAAALRASVIVATIETAGDIAGGEYLSIGDRLHVISEVLEVDGAEQTWSVWPLLREPAPAGTFLNFDKPICRMRLLSESEGDLLLDLGSYGFPDLTFIEAIED